MKHAIWMVLALVVGLAQPVAAQTDVSAGDAVAWDFVDSALAAQTITRFEVCFDGAASGCTAVTPATGKFTDAPPAPSGSSSYKTPLPAFTIGSSHTVAVRACNVSACGALTSPLAFRWVLATPTSVPSNLRIKVGG